MEKIKKEYKKFEYSTEGDVLLPKSSLMVDGKWIASYYVAVKNKIKEQFDQDVKVSKKTFGVKTMSIYLKCIESGCSGRESSSAVLVSSAEKSEKDDSVLFVYKSSCECIAKKCKFFIVLL